MHSLTGGRSERNETSVTNKHTKERTPYHHTQGYSMQAYFSPQVMTQKLSLKALFTNSFQIRRNPFKGCLRDVRFLTQLTPEKVYTPLNWSSYEEISEGMPTWEGCPVGPLEKGVHLYGSGTTWLVLYTSTTVFLIELKFIYST